MAGSMWVESKECHLDDHKSVRAKMGCCDAPNLSILVSLRWAAGGGTLGGTWAIRVRKVVAIRGRLEAGVFAS